MSLGVPSEASLPGVVRTGERLRMELLDALRLALLKTERAAVLTELVMFHGQAFRMVYDAAMRQPSPGPLTDRVMTECVCGLSVYREWLTSETPVIPWRDYERMTEHWRRVTGMVLREED